MPGNPIPNASDRLIDISKSLINRFGQLLDGPGRQIIRVEEVQNCSG